MDTDSCLEQRGFMERKPQLCDVVIILSAFDALLVSNRFVFPLVYILPFSVLSLMRLIDSVHAATCHLGIMEIKAHINL